MFERTKTVHASDGAATVSGEVTLVEKRKEAALKEHRNVVRRFCSDEGQYYCESEIMWNTVSRLSYGTIPEFSRRELRAWIALVVGSAIRTSTRGRKLRWNGTFRVQKIGLFGLLHSYCVIMHTCVLMFAFPF
jgi:hypothetical protein